jgi:hypothetical protein
MASISDSSQSGTPPRLAHRRILQNEPNLDAGTRPRPPKLNCMFLAPNHNFIRSQSL